MPQRQRPKPIRPDQPMLWCANCNRQSPSTPVTGTSDRKCNRCGQVIAKRFDLANRAESSQPGRKSVKRKKSSASKKANRARSAIKKQKQSCTNKDLNHDLIWRTDDPHSPRRQTASQDTTGPGFDQPLIQNHAYPRIRVAAFGIFLFLLGQILMIWSFIDGHFTAWTIGNLAIVTGLLLALWTNTIQLGITQTECRRLRNEVFRLRHLKNTRDHDRDQPEPPYRKTAPRPKSAKRNKKPN